METAETFQEALMADVGLAEQQLLLTDRGTRHQPSPQSPRQGTRAPATRKANKALKEYVEGIWVPARFTSQQIISGFAFIRRHGINSVEELLNSHMAKRKFLDFDSNKVEDPWMKGNTYPMRMLATLADYLKACDRAKFGGIKVDDLSRALQTAVVCVYPTVEWYVETYYHDNHAEVYTSFNTAMERRKLAEGGALSADALTLHQAWAIALYTQKADYGESCYEHVNKVLEARQEYSLEFTHLIPFLTLLVSAYRRLPPVDDSPIYCGSCLTKSEVESLRTRTRTMCFTKASASRSKAEKHAYATHDGVADGQLVLFELIGAKSYHIEEYSSSPEEYDVIAELETFWKVSEIVQEDVFLRVIMEMETERLISASSPGFPNVFCCPPRMWVPFFVKEDRQNAAVEISQFIEEAIYFAKPPLISYDPSEFDHAKQRKAAVQFLNTSLTPFVVSEKGKVQHRSLAHAPRHGLDALSLSFRLALENIQVLAHHFGFILQSSGVSEAKRQSVLVELILVEKLKSLSHLNDLLHGFDSPELNSSLETEQKTVEKKFTWEDLSEIWDDEVADMLLTIPTDGSAKRPHNTLSLPQVGMKDTVKPALNKATNLSPWLAPSLFARISEPMVVNGLSPLKVIGRLFDGLAAGAAPVKMIAVHWRRYWKGEITFNSFIKFCFGGIGSNRVKTGAALGGFAGGAFLGVVVGGPVVPLTAILFAFIGAGISMVTAQNVAKVLMQWLQNFVKKLKLCAKDPLQRRKAYRAYLATLLLPLDSSKAYIREQLDQKQRQTDTLKDTQELGKILLLKEGLFAYWKVLDEAMVTFGLLQRGQSCEPFEIRKSVVQERLKDVQRNLWEEWGVAERGSESTQKEAKEKCRSRAKELQAAYFTLNQQVADNDWQGDHSFDKFMEITSNAASSKKH